MGGNATVGWILGARTGTLTLTNSTVSGNHTYGDACHGGGVRNEGVLTLKSSTVGGNQAATGDSLGNGGGLWNGNGGIATLKNSIIAGNGASSDGPHGYHAATLTSSDHNLLGNASGCHFAPQAGDQLNVDPLLGSLQDNGGSTETCALLVGSPGIGPIPVSSCADHVGAPITTDQCGVSRPQGSACDIGAYEMTYRL